MNSILKLQEQLGKVEAERDELQNAHDEFIKSFEEKPEEFSSEYFNQAKKELEVIAEKNKEIERINGEIEAQKYIEQERAKKVDKKAATERRGSEEQRAAKNYSFSRAFDSLRRSGKLEGIEAEVSQEARNEASASSLPGFQGDFALPASMVKLMGSWERAMSVGTTTTGGHGVPEVTAGIVPVLRPRLKAISMGTQVQGGMVGTMKFPRHTTVETASVNSEVGAGNEVTPTFDTYSVEPHRMEAYTTASKQLLFQAPGLSEGWIRQNLEFAVAKLLDSQVLAGSGAGNNIEGISNITGIGSVSYNASDPFASLVDLETAIAVDDADVDNMGYLTTPGVRGALKQTRIDSGSGIMVWGQGNTANLNGYMADVSTQVTVTSGTPDTHYIYFGNWADGTIYQWNVIDIVVDPYSLRRTAQIEIVINGWYDYAVQHPESFALITDATL